MKVENDVIGVLKNAVIDENCLRITEQLDRKLYQKTAKVLNAMGGKWVSSKKATVFPEGTDIERTIAQIAETGVFKSLAHEFQYFPTPEKLAKRLVEMARILPGDSCLEPSAGRGSIAKFMPGCDCIELNEENRAYLSENGFNLIHDDFMTFKPQKSYDVIVMNPPFCKGQDASHILKAIDIAQKTVIAVAGSGAAFRNDGIYKELRKKISDLGCSIEPLPEGSFKESGTSAGTVVITVRKGLK